MFRNFQAEIGVPYRLGNASERDSGDVNIDGLYNVNAETLDLPAFALRAAGWACRSAATVRAPRRS